MANTSQNANRRVAGVQRRPQPRGDEGRAPEAEAGARQRREQEAAKQQLLRQRCADADHGRRQWPVRSPHQRNERAQIRVQVVRNHDVLNDRPYDLQDGQRQERHRHRCASRRAPRGGPARRARVRRAGRAASKRQQHDQNLPEGKRLRGRRRWRWLLSRSARRRRELPDPSARRQQHHAGKAEGHDDDGDQKAEAGAATVSAVDSVGGPAQHTTPPRRSAGAYRFDFPQIPAVPVGARAVVGGEHGITFL